MLKTLLGAFLALMAAAAFAAVDVNKATQADLESMKGIGPGISGKILDERKKGAFKDWQDLIDRVKGIGEGNAAKFSAEGLTVNGAAFKGAAPMAKKDDAKAMPAKAEAPAKTEAAAKKAEAMPAKEAAMAKDAKADDKKAKAEAKDKPAATAAAASASKK